MNRYSGFVIRDSGIGNRGSEIGDRGSGIGIRGSLFVNRDSLFGIRDLGFRYLLFAERSGVPACPDPSGRTRDESLFGNRYS